MDFKALVTSARSCRRFYEEKPLSIDDLEWLVDCARLAPSARNAQILRYVLVGPGQTCQELFPLTRWAGALKDWGGPFPGERPTGFIAIMVPQEGGELVSYDVGIAGQTIQLAATSRGWGCCFIYAVDREKASVLLQVPDGMKIAVVMGLGVAKEERAVTTLPADGSTAYWRDAQGVHYVPKRPLSELILARY